MNSKQFATVVIITFIVGMIWLATDIIFNTKASIQISDKLQVLLEPVNPNFNARVLEIIDEETLSTNAVKTSDPVPVSTAEPSPVSSPTPLPSLAPPAPPAASASAIVTPSPQLNVIPLPSGVQAP